MAKERDVDQDHQDTDLLRTAFNREELSYTSHFCEENIYKLLTTIQQTPSFNNTRCNVIFLSNATKSIPLFCQRLAKSPYLPVIWDYHVVLICEVVVPGVTTTTLSSSTPTRQAYVYDFDTTLVPFPIPFEEYFAETIQELRFRNGNGDNNNNNNDNDNDDDDDDDGNDKERENESAQEATISLKQRFRRLFRIVPADVFFTKFSSSRKHMKDSEGLWLATPPPWPLIRSTDAETEHTLDQFLDFTHETSTDDGYGGILDEADFWEAFASVSVSTNLVP